MQLTAVLTPAEEGGFVALNPETGTTTQGETVEEAVANLHEATALYLSEFPLPARGRLHCADASAVVWDKDGHPVANLREATALYLSEFPMEDEHST